MAGITRTYSPDKVAIIVSGYSLPGLLNVSLTFNQPAVSIKRGIRGQNTRVINPDSSARLSLEVLQTSPTNDILFQIMRLDKVNKSARLDLTLSDVSGHTILQSSEAYVSSHPNITLSDGFNPRVWEFDLLSVSDGNITAALAGPESIFDAIGSRITNAVSGIANIFN